MKVSYDAEIDAMYIYFSDRASIDSEELSDGVIADYGPDGKVVALEVLNASRVLDLSSLREEPIPLVLNNPQSRG
jgi:uncharacterized protein YuzE